MNSLDLSPILFRRKTQQEDSTKIKLDFPKSKNPNFRHSISIKKKNNTIIQTRKRSSKGLNSSKRVLNDRPISYSSKQCTYFDLINNKIIKINNLETKRKSNEIMKTRTHNLIKRDILEIINEYNSSSKKKTFILNNSNNHSLKIIEDSIKKRINNMKIEFEKKTKKLIKSSFSTKNMINQFTSIYHKKKIKDKTKKRMRGSLLIEENHIFDKNEVFNIKLIKKRCKSFDYNENTKNRILSRIKYKIYKKFNEKLTTITSNISFDDDIDKEKNSKGFSFAPNSNFIFIFDILLIAANLYNFIFIPLKIAQNNNIREKDSIIKEIIHCIIDLIYLFDLIIGFFRGYYNYDMEIIRNNKKIFYHYLKGYFIIDLLESIPNESLIRIFMKPNNRTYFAQNNIKQNISMILFLIKPFKVFKIVRKRQNKALEDFYTYLSENYYLERLIKFLIYFLIFFLFVHLFVCLHIYLAQQSYPNWMTYTNIVNKTFIEKYITSFYFMITTMTTVGYGDIICISTIERTYHIILLVIGTLLYTFLVSKIGNYLRDQSHEQIKLNKDLNILESIRITYPTMSFNLYSKIKYHLLSIFNKRKKTGISLLLNGVPDAIKIDLLFKIYSNVINNFIFFKNVKNSNFIHQTLTSFIPLTMKKEETVILEGETIQNIIFVKDGRLSMEIAIDLNDPYKSIQKYIEINFIGISRHEELKNYNYFRNINSIMTLKTKNFNDLKNKIDNILLDNQKITTNNNSFYNNGISVDLGRMDFSRNELDQSENSNFQIIKILDIRKNEYYGDIHLFLEQPSPFTLKAKSRIVELLILRKNDAIMLSKNFPNIWRRIQNKSYHNLVSIKYLTFKTLKKYYNIYFYNKNNKEKNIILNLDMTRNSIFSNSENNISFSTANKKNNLEQNVNKTNNFQNIANIKTFNNINNKNKILSRYNQSKRNSEDTFSKELNFSYNSFNSGSLQNNSQFKFPNSIITVRKDEIIKEDKFLKLNSFKFRKSAQLIKKKALDNYTFKQDNESIKHTLSSPKKLMHINTFKSKNSLTSNSQNQEDKNIEIESSKNESSQNDELTQKINSDKSSKNILTLKNFNESFSKKIKKIIRKRKKIHKLKELLKLQRFKINKNLLELNLKKNTFRKDKNDDSLSRKQANYSVSSSNYNIISKILDSSTSEGNTSSLIKSTPYLESQSFKIITSDSFEIRSSYKNFNILSKGEIINNNKLRKFLESLIIKYINHDISYEEIYKEILSLIYENTKKENNKEVSFKFCETENETKNEEIFFSENKLVKIPNKNLKKIRSEISNNLSNKKLLYNLKLEKTLENAPESICDKKTNKKLKNSSKFCEKVYDNFERVKLSDTDSHKKQKTLDIKNKGIKSNFIKGNLEEKKLYKKKESNKIINEEINKNLNEKNKMALFNKLFDYNKKNNKSKFENQILCLDKNNNNSSLKMINDNSNDEKEKSCIVY